MHKNHLNSAQSDLVGQQTNIKEQNQIYVQSPRFLPLRVYLSETNSIWDGKVSHYDAYELPKTYDPFESWVRREKKNGNVIAMAVARS